MGRNDRPRSRLAVTIVVAVWILAVATGLEGHTGVSSQEASVSGTTTALGGSVQLPGVSIIVADSITGDVVATTTSDGEGRFELSGLPSGIYVVTASLGGVRPGLAHICPRDRRGASRDRFPSDGLGRGGRRRCSG